MSIRWSIKYNGSDYIVIANSKTQAKKTFLKQFKEVNPRLVNPMKAPEAKVTMIDGRAAPGA